MTSAEPTAPDVLVTVAEASRQLGVGKTKVYALIKMGEINSITLPSPSGARSPRRIGQTGGKPARRIPQSEIDAFIERNRQQALA